jgi:predicted metal-dependent peptidase
MNISTPTILDEVAKTSIDILLQEPFYAHFFMGLNRQVNNHITQTMGIGQSGVGLSLYVNADYWQNTIPDKLWRYGLLKHEILHLVFRHIIRSGEFGNKKIYYIGCDLVVNQYIDPRMLPPSSIFLHTFPDLKLKYEQTVDYYYQELMKLYNESCCGAGETCTSESGSRLLSVMSEGEALKSHETWKEIAQASHNERMLLQAEIEDLIKIAAKRTGPRQIGNMPSAIRTALEVIVHTKPSINWKQSLRIFSASSSRTYIKNTLSQPSKRYGTTPGIKIRKRNRLLVAIDTSGSIGTNELGIFFNELYYLWKQGAEIRVVECDCAIANEYEYKGKVPQFVKGGGGTDFDPVMEYANRMGILDGIIYFTDGIAEIPKQKSKAPVFWLIAPEGAAKDELELPGRVVKMIV